MEVLYFREPEMIRKVIEYFKEGGPVGNILAGLIYICAWGVRWVITMLLGMAAGLGLTLWSQNSSLIGLACTVGIGISFVISFSIRLDGPLGFLSVDALLHDPKEARRKVKKPDKFSDLPHFEKMLKKDQVMNIVNSSQFSPYKTKDGKELKHITVSEDDKWICMFGGYMPVDLICGYNRKKNVIYTIDGGMIGLPLRAKYFGVKNEIDAFFKDRGVYYTDMPRKADEKFDKAFQRPDDVLDKADFSRLRYLWEKANASDKDGYLRNKQSGYRYIPIFNKTEINRTIFERVLSDVEVAKTADAIRKKKAPLSSFLHFTQYKNEFCVCNAVEVMNTLRYPANADGMSFLFKCIRDVDEAYFGPAVDVLKTFPKGNLHKKIEEEVKKAFESGDVVHAAGVMYLAKEIDYEIEYVEEMKKVQAEAAENAGNAEAAESTDQPEANAIPKFDYDEYDAYGTEEVQGFEAGGVAYQKKV